MNINSISLKLIFFITIVFLFPACEKDPGRGGLATITGKVKEVELDDDLNEKGSSYMVEQRVYISYGDNTWIDDDTRSSYTGEYAFQWLQKGDYTIWITGDCDSCPDSMKMDIIKVSIKDKRETVVLRDLIYYND